MRHTRALYIIGVLLLASCGKQYDAEQTVKDFVEANMEHADQIKGQDFGDLGTTRLISDSLIGIMRQRGATNYRQGINYGKVPTGDLYYLRMRYVDGNDTLNNTFYLNQELTEVVAFK